MKRKNWLLIVSFIFNLVLLISLLIKHNPTRTNLAGTYTSNTGYQYSMSFDKEKKLYVLYEGSDLKKVDKFEESNTDDIYLLKGDDLNKYIILKNKSFYYQISEGNFIKFDWDSNGMSFVGEVPQEYKDKK